MRHFLMVKAVWESGPEMLLSSGVGGANHITPLWVLKTTQRPRSLTSCLLEPMCLDTRTIDNRYY